MPEFDKEDELAKTLKLNKVDELAEKPELDQVDELVERPDIDEVEFAFTTVVWVVPLLPQLSATTFRIVASNNMEEGMKETLPPPPDEARRGMPLGKVGQFEFVIDGAFATSLPAIALNSGVYRTTGVPPEVVTFALAFTIPVAVTAALSKGGVEVCDIVALQGESWV